MSSDGDADTSALRYSNQQHKDWDINCPANDSLSLEISHHGGRPIRHDGNSILCSRSIVQCGPEACHPKDANAAKVKVGTNGEDKGTPCS